MKALILAAGYGTRLGDLTKEIPKPMLDFDGVPLLERTLSYLKANGFDEIAINLHFLPEIITAYFQDGEKWGVQITYSYEDELLGTAGAVRKLEDFFQDTESFLVIYGDLLLNQDLREMVKQHDQTEALATLLLHQRQGSNSLVKMDAARRINDFIERPNKRQRAENPFPWVNSGVQILSDRIIEMIPEGKCADLPKDIYMKAVENEKLFGFPLEGNRFAIDSEQRYKNALKALNDGSFIGMTA